MTKQKSILLFTLLIVLLCCVSVVSAASNDTVSNSLSEIDLDKEFVSVNEDEHVDSIDEFKSVLSVQEDNLSANDILKDDDGFEDDDSDDGFEDEDEEYELEPSEINEILEDIKLSTSDEYYNFVKSLLDTKKFSFNPESFADGGYKLFSTEKYEKKLYDGDFYQISKGMYYFVSTIYDLNLYVEGFYPNTLHYDENGNIVFDKLYYNWQNSQTNMYVDYNYKETTSLPTKYDLRDYNYVTSVKNQGEEGNCWAFASIAALESYLLKNEGKTYDFSENNLKNIMSSLGSIGIDKVVNGGGNIYMSIPYFLRWSGPILEKDDKYISNNVIDKYKPVKHVQGIYYILTRTNPLDNDNIKYAIMNYGGVVTSIYWKDFFVNTDTSSYYNPFGTSHNHEICIVGWDDNYSKSNFKFQLDGMGDGAFIIKNSWGTDKGDNGYYYVSYYDPTLAIDVNNSLCSYVFTDVEDNNNYGFNYHYTPLGLTSIKKINNNDVKFYNEWVSHKDDTLEACGFYNFIPSSCQIKVLTEGKTQTTVRTLDDLGFHTIKLDQPIDIKKGQKFRIEITLTSIYTNFNYVALEKKFKDYSKIDAHPGESFVYIDGKWKDMSEESSSNVCLNAYTKYFDLKETKINANNLVINYGENKFLDITLMDINNNPIKNAELIISINKNENKLNTDNNGKVRLSLKDYSASKVDIDIKYWGDKTYDYSQKKVTVTIKQMPTTITVNSFTYKDKYLKIDLKKGNVGISNKNIKISINGKKYNVKTNSKGRATLKASKSVFTANFKVTVQFNGDANYKGSSSNTKIKQLIINMESLKSTYKTNEKVAIKLDKKVSLKLKVTVKINGKSHQASFKTNKKGKTNLNLYSKFKKYNLKTKNNYAFEFNCCNKNYLLKKNSSKKISFKK